MKTTAYFTVGRLGAQSLKRVKISCACPFGRESDHGLLGSVGRVPVMVERKLVKIAIVQRFEILQRKSISMLDTGRKIQTKFEFHDSKGTLGKACGCRS